MLVFSLQQSVSGQLPQYQLQAISGQQGLKTADIINIARDRDGFLWLASQSHVQRFDGAHTRIFPFDETISQVYCDRQNRKWVLARGKIYLLGNKDVQIQEKICIGPEGKGAIRLFDKPGGELGLLRTDGFYEWNAARQQFEPEKPGFQKKGETYRGIFASLNSGIFFSTTDSVFYRQHGAAPMALTRFKSLRSIIPFSPTEFLVSTFNFETYHVSMPGGKWTRINRPPDDPNPERLLLFTGEPINPDEWLLASTEGLFVYRVSSKTISKPSIYTNGRLLQNQGTITHLYRDEDGSVFMNHSDGLYALIKGASQLFYVSDYQHENSRLPDNDIRNFTEDANGNIWLATTMGLAVLNMQTGALKSYTPSTKNYPISFPSMRQVLADGPLVWIGTSGKGIWKYDSRNGLFSRPFKPVRPEEQVIMERLNNTYTWKMLKLPGDRLFVASGSSNYLLDLKKKSIQFVNFPTSSSISRSALLDSSGRIWHGTVNGLSCVNNSLQALFAVRDSFTDKRVANFCEWRANRVLIASKGLYEIVVDNDTIASFQKKKGFPAERFIYCLKQDRKGYVWAGTDDGLFRYDPVHDITMPFGQADQVQTQAFNSDALFLDQRGWMYAGGKNGFNYFIPDSVRPLNIHLKPALISFTMGANDSVLYQQRSKLEVPYNQRDIRFSISAPNFTHPFQIQYRYKIEGYSRQWIYNGNNYAASISNLPPGNYALTVSAGLNNRWWNAAEPFSFTILKPWWQSIWFKLLVLAMVAILVLGILYKRRLNRKNLEIKKTIDYFALSGAGHASAEEILWDIARNCISRLGFEDCVIYLLDEQRQMLVQKAAYGPKSPVDFQIVNPIEIPLGQGITGYVALTGKPLLVPDTSKDSRYLVDDEPRASELAIPIVHEGKTIGVLDSEHSRKRFFTTKHLETLQTIVSLCSAKISAALARDAMRKAREEMTGLHARMLESKFMNLRLQMNPHFLFNTLSSIQYLVISNQTNKANKYLSIFSGYLRAMLQHAETTMVSLEEELRMLKLYIELESLVLDESFTWQIVMDDEIDPEEIMIPCMLLQPFVENAIHHGLMHKVGEKRFDIQFQNHDEAFFTCLIEDNGIGRKAAESLKISPTASVMHESRAMAIVADRLNLIGEKTSQQALMQIEDIYKQDQPAGTRVILQIPYYNSNLS